MNITKSRFDAFLKMQKSGKMNMLSYDMVLCQSGRYEACHAHFVDNKKESDLEVQ